MSVTQDAQLDRLVQQWLEIDTNETTRTEIIELHQNRDYQALDKKLSTRIAFGTAGLRSSMEAGFAHMNDVTILQASQGLMAYLKKNGGTSIVVGYDHRHHSQRFAEITASVALACGLAVHYLGTAHNLSQESDPSGFNSSSDRSYVHTPMVPFTIDELGGSAGVMVTASHNPAKDNGYKVYYGNGCQIIPPHDTGIARSIDENLEVWNDREVWNVKKHFDDGLRSGLLREVKAEMSKRYIDAVRGKLIASSSPSISFSFVYTPMHGVGLEIFEKICAEFGVSVDSVPQQSVPDPEFPTVRFPNPEEKGALDLAISRAEKENKQLVVASDPDADRFSVAIKRKDGGNWQQLTGNEIGILFAVYILEQVVDKATLPQTYLVNSTVSSQLLRSIAEKNGVHFVDTLTGFKWIGNKAIDLHGEGYQVPFAYEEAIGYMFSVVNDKDGISAAVVWLQLYEAWFANGQIDAVDKLNEIYEKYGWSKECNGYYKLDDLKKTNIIFSESVRSFHAQGLQLPTSIGDFTVVSWRDLTLGYDSSTPDHVPELPTDKNSQMVTAELKLNGSDGSVRFTCRGLGTEPKLKVYIEGTSLHSGSAAKALARQCWDTLRAEWFRPEKYGLEEVEGE